MELKLAKDEVMVKSWDYAYQGGGKKAKQANLTITSKRIVTTIESPIELDREEIRLSEVRNISSSYGACHTFWARVKLVLGIIFCITVIGLVIGIAMIKSALATLRACDLEIEFETRRPASEIVGESLCIGAYAEAGKKSWFIRFLSALPFIGLLFKHKAKPIRVNKEIAKEIINEVGAAILDSQA